MPCSLRTTALFGANRTACAQWDSRKATDCNSAPADGRYTDGHPIPIGPVNRFRPTVDRWAQLTLLSRADQSGAQSSKPMPMAAMHLSVRVQAVALHRQRTEHARVVREAAASGNGLKWDWLSGNACARGWAVAGGTSLRWATCLWSRSSDTCTRQSDSWSDRNLSDGSDSIGTSESLRQPKPAGVLRASTRPPSQVRLKER